MEFYQAKVEELGNNLKDLEVIVQRKQTNVRTIEEGKFKTIHWTMRTCANLLIKC